MNGPRIVPPNVFDALVKDNSTCLHCGAKHRLYPHSMDWSKCRTLQLMAAHQRMGDEWVRCEEGHGMIGCQTRHATKAPYATSKHIYRLGYYNLVEQIEYRVADWRITAEGLLFLEGKIDVPAKLAERKAVVKLLTKERVFIDAVKNIYFDKDYWDRYAQGDFW